MKKIYHVFIFLIFFFSSCSKDFLKSYDRRIVGTWYISDIDRTGFGGSTSNLPFQEGQFTFNSDGTLTYINSSGAAYSGTWNIEKKTVNDNTYKSLEINAVNFTSQEMRGEYYDDMDFVSTDHFKTKIFQGLHTYVTHFRR